MGVDEYVPDPPECNGQGCLVRHSGLHHDKINGPHYWCVECPGCSRCRPKDDR